MKLDLQDRKLWIAGAVMAGLLVIAVAWLFLIGPMRSNTATLNSQAADAITQNDALLAQNAALERDSTKLPAYRAQLVKAIDSLPPNTNLPELTKGLSAVAAYTGVTLSSISVGGIQAATAAPAAAPATTSTSTPSTSASAAPAAAASSAAPSQLIANLTLQITGSPINDLRFLEAVRLSPRSALITSTQFTDSGKNFLLTAQIEVFSAPESAAQLATLRALLTTAK